MSSKDYYSTLGVDKKASKDEIKKAFRKLAQKHHPDKKGGDEKKFKEINEAYNILSDDKKRAEYDSYGRVFSGSGGGGGQAGGGFGGFDFSDFAKHAQNGQGFEDFDLGDIFGEFFGGGARGRTRRGNDIAIDVELEFSESVFGTTRTVQLNKTSTCDACKGDGAEPGSGTETCSTCNGKGQVQEVKHSFMGTFQTNRTCDLCRGSGRVPKVKCGKCAGEGVAKKDEEITLSIPAGIEDGQMIRMTGAGEAVPGGQAGDLYIKVHVKPHATFTKQGRDLLMPLSVKLSDALLGATYSIETLDGPIDLKIPQGVTHGEMLRVKGKGVPDQSKKRGDILVKVQIQLPQKLSKEARKAVEKLQEEGI
ncbi:MAG: molecular chaperone DnaJ [Candidatus Paceibacterota bacterium]